MTSQSERYSFGQSDNVLRCLSWRTVSNSAAYLRPHIAPEMTILDVGCGPGSISVDMAKLVPKGRVVGVDCSPEPLQLARAFATQQGVTNIEFQTGDVHALNFPDNTFDIVHAHLVLQHVPDPIQGLREMRRVVKPGGIVAFRESFDVSWYPESPGMKAFWDLLASMIRLKGGDPHPGKHIHTWAKAAGFERSQISCSTGGWCFSTPEDREYWGTAMDSVFSEFATKAAEMNLSQEDLSVQTEARWDWVKNDDGWFSFHCGEVICRKE